MAHSNQPFASPESYGYPENPPTVKLFDPYGAGQQRRSPQTDEQNYSRLPSVGGIPPLSNPSSASRPSDIPASVQARAGVIPRTFHSEVSQSHEAPNSCSPPPIPQRRKPRRSRQPVSTRRSSPEGMRSIDFRFLLAGSSVLAGLVLVGDVSAVFQEKASATTECQEVVQQDVALSRDNLSKLLTVPERQDKAAVREIVRDPYCLMPDLEVRAGVTAQREAYPLAFDPDTWLVVLYEGEEYAGYAFSFQP